jgi:hypothetical protein
VLDYFEAVGALLGASPARRAARTLFRFEGACMRFGEGDAALLSQLMWQIGLAEHGFPAREGRAGEAGVQPQPWRYLTGEARAR